MMFTGKVLLVFAFVAYAIVIIKDALGRDKDEEPTNIVRMPREGRN